MKRLVYLGVAVLAAVIGFGAATMEARAEALNIGFLSDELIKADSGIKDYWEDQGHTVTVLKPSSDNPTATQTLADVSDVVVISESIGSSWVYNDDGFHLRDHPVRVVSWEAYMYDDAGWTGTESYTQFGNTARPEAPEGLREQQTDIHIVDPDHPLAAGFPSGALTVYHEPGGFSYGLPSADADVIATADADGGYPVIFAYEKGDILANGSKAAGTRIGFLFSQVDPQFEDYTPEALALLSAAVPEPGSFYLMVIVGVGCCLGLLIRRRGKA